VKNNKVTDDIPAWTSAIPVSMLHTKSTGNAQFATAITNDADHVFAVPYKASDHKASLDGVKALDTVAALLTPIPPGLTSGNFDQLRIVVLEKNSNPTPAKPQSKARHITIKYAASSAPRISLTHQDIEAIRRAALDSTEDNMFAAASYSLNFTPVANPTAKGKDIKTVSLARITPKLYDDGTPILNIPYAHVTEDSGAFSAADMKTLTQWIIGTDDDSIQLSTKERPPKQYTFSFQEANEVQQTAPNGKTFVQKIPANYKKNDVRYEFLGVAAFLNGDDAFTAPPRNVRGAKGGSRP
jgi:hypothetical protein